MKSSISLIALTCTSIILISGSLFQIVNDLVENNGHFYIKNFSQDVYANDDDDKDIEEHNKEADKKHD